MPCEVVLLRVDFFKMTAVAITWQISDSNTNIDMETH
jgi:hypothetical protein